ncbi:MAG: hypothetical protein Q7U53_05335 [Anaerolineaceae bacterium]|nr:hypothetical protein [Anaerolineaceae bacterium]
MNNTILLLFLFFIIFILISGLILYLTPLKNWLEIKKISSIINLKKSIGLSIEHGKGLHISLGKSNLNNIHGAASLIGINTLSKILDQSILSDNPPVATSGSGDVTLLAQTTFQNFGKEKAGFSSTEQSNVFLSGPTNMSYIAGAMPSSSDKDLSTQILVGNLSSEIGLLLNASNRAGNYSLSATDNLEGQAVSYVYSDETLIGEQIFSIPAQLDNNKIHALSLIVHDFLRWVIIIAIFLVAFLKIIGIL